MYMYNLCHINLRFEGSDGSTTFTDSSRVANTFTAVGNARIRTADYKIGSSSLYLGGTGDYVTSTTTNGAAFSSNQYDSCLEFYIRLKAAPAAEAMIAGLWRETGSSRSYAIFINAAREILLKRSTIGTDTVSHSTGYILPLDTWTHLRLRMSGPSASRVLQLLVDGVVVYTTSASTLYNLSGSSRVYSFGATAGGNSVMSVLYIDWFFLNFCILICFD